MKNKKVLITGIDGFIGRNLSVCLSGKGYDVLGFGRSHDHCRLENLIDQSDFIVHCAGVNRTNDDSQFIEGNVTLTQVLCDCVGKSGRGIPLIYTSSYQAALENAYGSSKKRAEDLILSFSEEQKNPVKLIRLPGIFGKWARPNYNSVVATFCYNIARNLPISIHDPERELSLVYIDDVVSTIEDLLANYKEWDGPWADVNPKYPISLSDLAAKIYTFCEERRHLLIENIGNGFDRALYATYLSYLNKDEFVYDLSSYDDERGSFFELIKTHSAGQFSLFTAKPGVTRGGHYHHTKNEKFFVVKGSAEFKFRNLYNNDSHSIVVSGQNPKVVITPPGWVHDITNIGDDELIVLLWSNEIFDKTNPDTYRASLS